MVRKLSGLFYIDFKRKSKHAPRKCLSKYNEILPNKSPGKKT